MNALYLLFGLFRTLRLLTKGIAADTNNHSLSALTATKSKIKGTIFSEKPDGSVSIEKAF
jgi:hypothetical protein